MSPYELIAAITIILTGVPVYLLFVLWDNKPRIVYTPWGKFLFKTPNNDHFSQIHTFSPEIAVMCHRGREQQAQMTQHSL